MDAIFFDLLKQLSPAGQLAVLQCKTDELNKERLTKQYKEQALDTADAANEEENRAVYMFAGRLGPEGIKAFFNTVSFGAVPLRLRKVGRGTWIAVFESHRVARNVIANGHGRFPFPWAHYPYFDKKSSEELGEMDDLVRIDMRWAIRR